ncbi:MAG: hypothetical protein HY883_06110 [Deltaproteobacteria bacterium]|nr:hypothetical protein [Deltaproteobacteria bacterium]
MSKDLRNSAFSSGRLVFMYIPLPSSNPAAFVILGTIATYQWQYSFLESRGRLDRMT